MALLDNVASTAKLHHIHAAPLFLFKDEQERALKVVRAHMKGAEGKLTAGQQKELAHRRKVMDEIGEALRAIG